MNPKHFIPAIIVVLTASLFVGCQSGETTKTTAAPAAATPTVTVTVAPTPAPVQMPVRIDAGSSTGYTNTDGKVWLADQGFADGDTIERPDIQITNTDIPAIYQSEHYSMTSFSWPVPNGKYIVKLHFCETFDGITGPGDRVFSFSVQGHEFKDFDVWVKAGGPYRAYVETVPIEVTDGKVQITFTPNVENPQINGIEIIPAS
jgi:Malectin domain